MHYLGKQEKDIHTSSLGW